MIWIIAFVFIASFSRPALSASCCTNGERSDLSAEEQRDALLRGVRALDRLHRFWFQRRLLAALHIDEMPPEANVWRRRRDQQRRSISSSEQNSGGAEENEQVRRYTLRVVGIADAHHQSHAHRRHHNAHRRGAEDAECNFEKSIHYSFFSKIPPSSPTPQQYETELEKAELELWHTNESLPDLHIRNRPNVEDDAEFIRSLTASWSLASPQNGGWSPFRLVQGQDDGQENGSFFVSDVTNALRSFWSKTDGANVTITLARRNEREAACVQSLVEGRRRHHKKSRTQPDDESRPALVLKLSLIEKSIQRSQRKRSIGSFPTNVSVGAGRRQHRQMMIQDCESQWDAGFLRETAGQYDDLMPCCRRKVNIDFSDLGWGSWVVSPLAFDSFYCMGRCTSFGGFASADTEGAAFYTEAMNLYRDARNSGLTPCCSPVKFSPLTITVLIGDNEEMTQTLEDVVVKQCGCM